MIAAKTVRFFLQYGADDPVTFMRMIGRRTIERFGTAPPGVVVKQIGDVNYEIDMSIHQLMRKYFFQTHEMFLERVFQQYLRPAHVFVDIGANCGYWSAHALSRVGRDGAVHAFEPVPHYFSLLRRLAKLNPGYNVFANAFACGARPGRYPMVVVPPRPDNFDNYNTNIGSSSLQPGFLDHDRGLTETIDVDVVCFDQYVTDHNVDIERIGLIKIDVEGFELSVLDGMQNLLAKPGRKIPILCEILTDLDRDHPLDGRRVIERLEATGYRCLNATNLRPIDSSKLGFEENILCV